MIGSISFFVLSLIGLAAMLFYKEKPEFIRKSDQMIMKLLDKGGVMLKLTNKRSLSIILHYFLEIIEDFSIKVFRRLKEIVRKLGNRL